MYSVFLCFICCDVLIQPTPLYIIRCKCTENAHFYFLFYNSKNVALAHHKILLAIVFDFGASILAIENFVADLQNHIFVFCTVTNSNHLARISTLSANGLIVIIVYIFNFKFSSILKHAFCAFANQYTKTVPKRK